MPVGRYCDECKKNDCPFCGWKDRFVACSDFTRRAQPTNNETRG